MKTYTVHVYNDGSKFWYLNDKCHREDGPAREFADGSKQWWLNDELHRTDGPAVERPDGRNQWWLNGKELTKEAFNSRMKSKSCSNKIVDIDGVKYTLSPVEK